MKGWRSLASSASLWSEGVRGAWKVHWIDAEYSPQAVNLTQIVHSRGLNPGMWTRYDAMHLAKQRKYGVVQHWRRR
ncbi:hypothetical protein GYMLUDRAFT_45485, partial [Collybiopsis luxurians FD-317 M1]